MVLKNNEVVLIPLNMINDNTLSIELRGFLCSVCSFNQGEMPTVKNLCKIMKEDKKTILRLIAEGIKSGYLSEKSILRDEDT